MARPTPRPALTARRATLRDVPVLARFNRELIADEQSRTRLSVAGLEQRLRDWISEGYRAVLFELGREAVGYALLRETSDGIHLRQMTIARAHRRRGIGRAAVELLRARFVPAGSKVWLEVLAHNEGAREFWRSVGFVDHLMAMEWHPPGSTVPDPPTHQVFIALGSNLGSSRTLLTAAMERLDVMSALPVRASSLWRTSPVDCPPGSPPFLNAVVAWEPPQGMTPQQLLSELQQLERDFGRRPKVVLNEPRPLDLDLIAWGRDVCRTRDLILPHPRAHQRQFVLAPLAELAPDFVLPGQRHSVRELLAGLRSDEVIERCDP